MAWTQRAFDDFTDTPGTLLENHTPNQGSAWSVFTSGSFLISVSNTCDVFTASTNEIARNTTSLANKQACEVVWLGALFTGLVIRMDSSQNGYMLFANGGSALQIYKVTAGSYSSLAESGSISDNQVMRFEADGTTLTGYANGVQQVQVTDATWSSGSAGLFGNSLGVTVSSFDDFYAYDDAGSAGNPWYYYASQTAAVNFRPHLRRQWTRPRGRIFMPEYSFTSRKAA